MSRKIAEGRPTQNVVAIERPAFYTEVARGKRQSSPDSSPGSWMAEFSAAFGYGKPLRNGSGEAIRAMRLLRGDSSAVDGDGELTVGCQIAELVNRFDRYEIDYVVQMAFGCREDFAHWLRQRSRSG